MDIEKTKAIGLIFDWNLWPRQSAQKLDSTNISRMKTSLKAGFKLPPIIVDKKSNRIVDGFHRAKATLDVFGDDAEIDVIFKKYKTDAEMFLDAGATNCYHGLTMSPKDRAFFINKCRKFKIPPIVVAESLQMDVKKMQEFLKSRTAKTENGETIILSAGAKSLAGTKVTKEQEHFINTSDGSVPEMHVAMLSNALKANVLMLTEKTVIKLRELRTLLDELIEGYENEK